MKRRTVILLSFMTLWTLAIFYGLGFCHGMQHEALERLEETVNRPHAWEEG
jgi:hypothetical protein